jgi:phospholipid transport system substrate-binding protein
MSVPYRYLNLALLLSVLLLTFAADAVAESAQEQLRGTLERIIEVLRTIQSPDDVERSRNSLRQIILPRFDFAAMAQKSLLNHWSNLNGKEEEFVSAFTDFLGHTYLTTLAYHGERVVYDDERADRESAEVDTRVVGGRGTPIKIRYKLHLTDGQWKVYDLVIDDISVVGNNRSQFARILKTASLEELIQKLRAKSSGR